MKRFIITAAFISLAFVQAFAHQNTTKAENDVAIQAGRKLVTAKAVQFESSIKNHNIQASQATASDMLALMRKGMGQHMNDVNFKTGAEHDAANQLFLKMERNVFEFSQLSVDVEKNQNQLIEHAHDFIRMY